MATAIDFFININLISETGASKAFFGVRANPYATHFPEIFKSLFHNSSRWIINTRQKTPLLVAGRNAAEWLDLMRIDNYIIHSDELWNNLLIIYGIGLHRARKEAMREDCLPAMCYMRSKSTSPRANESYLNTNV